MSRILKKIRGEQSYRKMSIKQPVVWAAVCLAAGSVAGFLQQPALHEWYPFLDKSPLTPPGSVFFVTWTILYILMGVSIGLVRQTHHSRRVLLTGLFLFQLAINICWSILFFYLRSPIGGLILIVLLFLLITAYTGLVRPVDSVAALLFIPYVLWVAFASYLNLYIYLNN